MAIKVQKKSNKAQGKKVKKREFAERFLEGNVAANPDNEDRPEKLLVNKIETPSVIAALNNDENVKSKTKQGDEENAPEGATFFGEAFINKNKLTGEKPGGPGDPNRFEEYRQMELTAENNLKKMRENQKKKIRDIRVNADSEEMMYEAIDYEILDGDNKQEQVLKDYRQKVARQTGDNQMEAQFDVSKKNRSLGDEILRLRHEQFSVKQRYMETYPEGEKKIRAKLKTKADQIEGQLYMERTGKAYDREPGGFW